MLLLKKPTVEVLRRFLDEQSRREFSYDSVGTTRTKPPRGFVVDHTRIRLGEGGPVFQAGSEALRRWSQFRLRWVEPWPTDTPIQAGEVVAVLAKVFLFWWLNACRIVYVVNEPLPIRRFGFAYGTLPEHAESGEERFVIEWDQADNSVWFDILAFSRPNHILTRLGRPWVRRIQKRFAREAVAALLAETTRIATGITTT
jgi:uncharacterized protein (UPF0548 family)